MNNPILVCILCLLLDIANGTLSPDSAKKGKKKNEIRVGPEDKDVFQRGLVKEKIKAQDIIRDAGTYYKNTNLRHYVSGEFLGYITPWNGDGYENSKKFHGKFDMVSPVWLIINSKNPFQIPMHDIQKSWIDEMKALDNKTGNNHYVKILPRILFEQWSKQDIENFYHNTQIRNELVDVLVNIAKTYSFDGYILELWNAFVLSEAKKKMITSIINDIAEGLRMHDLDTVLPVPPMRGFERELFTKKDFDVLSPHVKYFSLMTYDYSSIQRPGPNAPIKWIRKCIEYLVPKNNDVRRAQILMGLNFYGYQYTLEGGHAIVGSEYLKLLENYKGELVWDDKNEEHFFVLKSANGGYIFYPTLYSIKARLELANEMKTGVSIWELGQGLTYFFDIL